MLPIVEAIFATLKAVLGLGQGTGSSVNLAGGVVNHAAMLSAAAYLYSNRDEVITLSFTMGSGAIVVGIAWFVLEIMRRSKP